MVVRLFSKDAPKTVSNFVGLATGEQPWRDPRTGERVEGRPLYNGLTFHRVIPDFMIQGGDPLSKELPAGDPRIGTGGPGSKIKCETDNNPRKHGVGSLSMAHAGRDTGGSQFFITHSPQPHLDRKHTVFGQVLAGQDVVDAIERGDKIEKLTVSEG